MGRIVKPATLTEVLERSPRPRLFAAFDGISNAENLGVMVRNCAALGVQGLIVGETSCSPFLRRAVRSSMGAAFSMPIAETENLVCVCGVFIHWDAKDNDKIYQYNYEATKLSIARAMKGEPKIDEVLAKKDTEKHPFFK